MVHWTVTRFSELWCGSLNGDAVRCFNQLLKRGWVSICYRGPHKLSIVAGGSQITFGLILKIFLNLTKKDRGFSWLSKYLSWSFVLTQPCILNRVTKFLMQAIHAGAPPLFWSLSACLEKDLHIRICLIRHLKGMRKKWRFKAKWRITQTGESSITEARMLYHSNSYT